MPPVLHVPFEELPRRGEEDMGPRLFGGGVHERHAHPGAGRGIRRRRPTGRAPIEPRGGKPSPGRATIDSGADPSPGRGSGPERPGASGPTRRRLPSRPRTSRPGPRTRERAGVPPRCLSASPSRKTISVVAPGSRSNRVWTAAQGSIPAPTRPESSTRPRAAGEASDPCRPRNSVRSPVIVLGRRLTSAKATRSAEIGAEGIPRQQGSVSGSISVTTCIALASRDVPRTHSA